MNKIMVISICVIFFLLSGTLVINDKNLVFRYKDEIFPDIDIKYNITYGTNTDSNGKIITLLLDIYEPSRDISQKRPALIIIHGGGFTEGDKTFPQIVTLCTSFAKRGYVTASINYRLQPNETDDLRQALIQAVYDTKAAIRYIRATSDIWHIDIEKIAVIGSSAGAVTALYVSYLTGVEYEGDSGNPGFSSNVSACVDLWGGLHNNVNKIESGEPPVLIIHGTEDTTVPYSEAINISSRCQQVGVYCELHPLNTAHAPWRFLPDFLPWIVDFLYTHCVDTQNNTGIGTENITGTSLGKKTPGFELIPIIAAVVITAILFRRRR
jgi:acetyl esterase/lipase